MDISYIRKALPRIVESRISAPVLATIQKRACDWSGPAELITYGYRELSGPNGKANGDIFEGLFKAALIGSGFNHLLTSVEYKVLPYSKIDIVIYTKRAGPIMLSLKSSLRERWKQSDLEFGTIKRINPSAYCALATIDTSGCAMPRRLHSHGKLLGLNQVVDCNLRSQVESLFQAMAEMQPTPVFRDELLGLSDFKAFSH